jgi:hypothetical protein
VIYSQDGTPLFRPIELESHHPWCNHYFKERNGCKLCEGLYHQFPIDDSGHVRAADHFPDAELIDNGNM